MPRSLRVQYSNAWYHVMNRGAGRQKIFLNNIHREIFLETLRESAEMHNVIISAYCLMDNHYHLLLSTPDANLSRLMQHINGVYTQRFNRLTNKDGALFRGRYKAQLIEDNGYQLTVSRYIHLNPVEAGIVLTPAEYRWSSYRAYLGLTKTPSWLSKDIIIRQLSHIKNYQDYVECNELDNKNVSSAIKSFEPIIGTELFKEKILSTIDKEKYLAFSTDIERIKPKPSIDLIKRIVCSYYKIDNELISRAKSGTINWPKKIFIYLCKMKFGYKLQEIAIAVGFNRYETVSSIVHKCALQLKQYPILADEVKEIVDQIKSGNKLIS